ncbi:MAG: hypothetical protein EXS17_01175 [Phycisphaerales bacterium]|nr:hypothetical protein [Phycisphaerales bacterium]
MSDTRQKLLRFSPGTTSAVALSVVALVGIVGLPRVALSQGMQSPDPLGQFDAPTGGSSADRFGSDMAWANSFTAVSAPSMAVTPSQGVTHLAQGGVHLYRHLGDGEFAWTKTLTPIEGVANDWCGTSIAASERWVVAGGQGREMYTPATQMQAGVAWVWQFLDGNWVEPAVQLRHHAPKSLDLFGSSVALNERIVDGVLQATIAVGAPVDDEPGRTDCGSVTLFEWSSIPSPRGMWVQRAFITPPVFAGESVSLSAYGLFGSAIAFDGDYLFIGAKRQTSNVLRQGIVYVFRRNTTDNPAPVILQTNTAWGEWCLVQRLAASTAVADEQFGASISAQGGLLLVGAPGAASAPGSASIYEFTPSTATYTANTQLWAIGGQIGDRFGADVAISSNVAYVGAPGLDAGSAPIHPDRGAVFNFARNDEQCQEWSQRTKYRPPPEADLPGANFGECVDLGSEMVLIGAPHADNQTLGQGIAFSYAIDTIGCPTDLDGDGFTMSSDLTLFLAHWGGVTPSSEVADYVADGIVDGQDFAHILSNWGPCICSPSN